MGIKERREREKQLTRRALLDAARQIAQQEGWSALTLRKVAEQVEYSTPMVYQYFASKEDMLLELLQEGFQHLAVAMQQALARNSEPEDVLFQMGDAYWRFAHQNPDLYQLMHGMAGIPLAADAVARVVEAVCSLAQDALLNWGKANDVPLGDAMVATETMWSLLHGFVCLSILHRYEGGEAYAHKLLLQAIQDQLLAWRARAKKA